ncbi:TIGR04149 family rSAM-modified RiPP (plasmid) [Pseudoalteromonas sp. T1lg65]|uniref:TIGR04149 family rSAM-modified RiPP n=1 Tax=Pseudoalteromonas sp. T1lg65 TaxID=2077101 RepID=UPI003F7A2958
MKLKKVKLKTLNKNDALESKQTKQIAGGYMTGYSVDYGACHTSPVYCPTAYIC